MSFSADLYSVLGLPTFRVYIVSTDDGTSNEGVSSDRSRTSALEVPKYFLREFRSYTTTIVLYSGAFLIFRGVFSPQAPGSLTRFLSFGAAPPAAPPPSAAA